MILRLLPLTLAMHLGACQSMEPTPWQPATLTTTNPAIDYEIREVLRDMLNGAKLVLDVKELSRSPKLMIERAPFKDPNGIRLYGSEREMPQVFRLEMRGTQCRILQVQTGQSRLLAQASCQPAP